MQRIELPPPPALHSATIEEGLALFGHHPTMGAVAIVYCHRNRVGGRWIAAGQLWQVTGPIAVRAYLEHLRAGGHELPEGEVLEVWLASVDGRATAH